jgi:hypothetical protein
VPTTHLAAPVVDEQQERALAVVLLDATSTGANDGDAGDDRAGCGGGCWLGSGARQSIARPGSAVVALADLV